MTDTRQALLPCPFCGHDSPSFERMGTSRQSCIVECGNCGCRHESGDEGPHSGSSWNERAALSAQPVAGAVAHTSERHFALREAHCIKAQDDYFAARPVEDGAMQRKAFDAGFVRGFDAGEKVYAAHQAQAAPAPEQNAQAGWKLVPVEPTWDMQMAASSAYREPRDGHYTARMECAANAYRAMLAASPQPEPSAQGEPVAWISPKDRVPKGGEVVLCLFRDKGIHTALFRGTSTTHGVFEAWHGFLVADLPTDRVIGWVPLASAPSTPQPAVVEAVPLTIRQKEDALQEFTAWFVRNYPGPDTIISDPKWHAPKVFRQVLWAIERGIAPKAAQPVEGER